MAGAGQPFDYDGLLAQANTMADFLFNNDIVGSMIACQRARVNPDAVRPREITSEHYLRRPVTTQQEKIDKLTFIATYCIRNGVTHRMDDRSFVSTYDGPGDHFYRYDPNAIIVAPPNGYWATATALVLPVVANFDGGGGAGAPREERPLVVKINVIQQTAQVVMNVLRAVLSFGAARVTTPHEFAIDIVTLRRVQEAFDAIPQADHGLGFSRLYAYGVRDMGPNMSIGSIVMARVQGRSIRDVCHLVRADHNAQVHVGRMLAYAIPDMSGLPDWNTRGRPEYGHFGMLHNDLHAGNYIIDRDANRVNLIDFERVVFIERADTQPVRGITTLNPRDPCDEAIIQYSIIRDYVMMFLYVSDNIEPLNQAPTTSLSVVIHTALLASRNILFHRIQRFLTVDLRMFDDFPFMRNNLQNAQRSLRVIQNFINSAHTGVIDRAEYIQARNEIIHNEAYARHHIEAFHRHRRHRRATPMGGAGAGGGVYRDRTAPPSGGGYREPERRERERSRSPTSTRRRSPERRERRSRSPEHK
jgi:hypothetical protein